jgi:hypothetical protein
MSWYVRSRQLSASATATRNYLHEVDLAAAAGNVTITLPATGPDPTYVGVVNASTVGDGSKVVIVLNAALVEVYRLSAAGESVWLGLNPSTGAWEVLAHANPGEFQWTWADAAARRACAVSAAQIGAVGYQTDLGIAYDLASQAANVGAWSFRGPVKTTPSKGYRIHFFGGGAQGATTGVNFGVTYGAVTLVPSTLATPVDRLLRAGVISTAVAGTGTLLTPQVVGPVFDDCWHRWIFATEAVTANGKWFAGLGAPTVNQDFTTLLQCVGVGRGTANANVQLYRNDAAGATQATDLGADFSATTRQIYELLLRVRPSSVGGAVLQLTALATGACMSTLLTTELPTIVSPLPCFYGGNNVDAAASGISASSYDFWQTL